MHCGLRVPRRVGKHDADAMPRGLLLCCGRWRGGHCCKWLPARHVLGGRRFVRGPIQLPVLRRWRLPRVCIRVFLCEPVHGGLLLHHCIHKHDAGGLLRGLLLPRGHGLGHRKPLPGWHLLAWREHVHVCRLLRVVRRWLLPRCRKHFANGESLRRGLLLLLRHGQHAASCVPRGVLLPLGHWRVHRKPLPRGLLLSLWHDRGTDRGDQPVSRWLLPCHGVGDERRLAVHGGVLLFRGFGKQDAGRVPARLLLPRRLGRWNGEPMRRRHVRAGRLHLRVPIFLWHVRIRVLHGYWQRDCNVKPLRRGLLLPRRVYKQPTKRVPRGLLLRCGPGERLHKRLPRGLLLPSGHVLGNAISLPPGVLFACGRERVHAHHLGPVVGIRFQGADHGRLGKLPDDGNFVCCWLPWHGPQRDGHRLRLLHVRRLLCAHGWRSR